jgi:nucleotide-binding universal stress UspA family protein
MHGLDLKTRLSLKHILVPTDFSACAGKAMPFAVSLARKYGSNVYVAHVLPPEPHPVIPIEPVPQSMDPAYIEGEQEVSEFLRDNAYLDVPYEVILEKGEMRSTFDQIVNDHEIDLIVLATHGRHGARKLLLGSVAEELFRSATCPVLTLGPFLAPHISPDGTMKNILFATDFCAGSINALPYAMSLAEENGARLTFLHVLPEPGLGASATETYFTRERYRAKIKLELEQMIPRDEIYARDHSDFVVEYGMPAEIILGIAADKAADLIVMGVRRTAPLVAATRFPWATAHKVVAQAPCPVLTVRG